MHRALEIIPFIHSLCTHQVLDVFTTLHIIAGVTRIKLCPFQAAGSCRKGTNCGYAHSETELCIPISLRKTKLCDAWKKVISAILRRYWKSNSVDTKLSSIYISGQLHGNKLQIRTRRRRTQKYSQLL